MFALIQLVTYGVLGGEGSGSFGVVTIFNNLLVGFFGGT